MELEAWTRYLRFLPRWLLKPLERWLRALPGVSRAIDQETHQVVSGLTEKLKPYRDETRAFLTIPETGEDPDTILAMMREMKEKEEATWRDGFVSGAVYHGADDHVDFLNEVYALHSQTNPLHFDVWPRVTKYEAEIIAMTAQMMGRPEADSEICGSVTSGGTESILLAMKAYRDQAREERGIVRPEMIVPTTAHAAFDKASEYFGIRQIRIEVGPDYRARLRETERAIGRNTIVMVGSAISYPHGVIDPIEDLAAMAAARGIGFHTDACLGGFILPWARDLGYDIPPFDFRVPGVTSMSADTHKYGYAAKGSSVVLYRSRGLRRFQYYTTTEWPGGLYFSPTFAGSRPGAQSAMCWAAMVKTGRAGYLDATRRILEAGARIREAVEGIPELRVLGDPLWVIAFTSDTVNIYSVMDAMSARGWNLNGLHRPAAVHLAVTLRHTAEGVTDRFARDLKAAVSQATEAPETLDGVAPLYGMAQTMPLDGIVEDFLKTTLDELYEP